MFLPNPMVYIQFHPVTYVVKLNIEMGMASLIRKIARESNIEELHEASMNLPSRFHPQSQYTECDDIEGESDHVGHMKFDEPEDMKILKTTSVRVITSPKTNVHVRRDNMI